MIIQKCFLSTRSFFGRKTGMINRNIDIVLLQHGCYSLGILTAHTIYYTALIRTPGNEIEYSQMFFTHTVSPTYFERQIRTVERGDKNAGINQIQLFLDIFPGDLVGRSR